MKRNIISDSDSDNTESENSDNESNHSYSDSDSDSNINDVSTEGISEYELENQYYRNLKRCEYCNRFYNLDMIYNGTMDEIDECLCYHCLFWMNYSVASRKLVDGVNGMLIVDYILKCKDAHLIKTCTKISDNGGCFSL